MGLQGATAQVAKDHPGLVPAPLERGQYRARLAGSATDLIAAQRLRHQCFVLDAGRPGRPEGLDQDHFDATCDHVLVEDRSGALVCCYRVQGFATAAEAQAGYSGQFYDMTHLPGRLAPLLELGRFCVAKDVVDPDVLRVAWGMVARVVDTSGAKLLFGCSSFAGLDAAPYRGAFDLLAADHMSRAIGVKSAEVLTYGKAAAPVTDRRAALAQVPSLLRTYLSMGGWVSDHAVVDRAMNTLHVFTGLEIDAIPPARAAALRAVAR